MADTFAPPPKRALSNRQVAGLAALLVKPSGLFGSVQVTRV